MSFHPPGTDYSDTPPFYTGKICYVGDITESLTVTQDPDPVEFTHLRALDDNEPYYHGLGLPPSMFTAADFAGLPGVPGTSFQFGPEMTAFLEGTGDLASNITSDLNDTWFGNTKTAVGTFSQFMGEGVSVSEVLGDVLQTPTMERYFDDAAAGLDNLLDTNLGKGFESQSTIGISHTDSDHIALKFSHRLTQELGRVELVSLAFGDVNSVCVNGFWGVFAQYDVLVPINSSGQVVGGAAGGVNVGLEVTGTGFGDISVELKQPVAGIDPTDSFGYDEGTTIGISFDAAAIGGSVWDVVKSWWSD